MEKEAYAKAIADLQEIVLGYLEENKFPIIIAQKAVSGLPDYICDKYLTLRRCGNQKV